MVDLFRRKKLLPDFFVTFFIASDCFARLTRVYKIVYNDYDLQQHKALQAVKSGKEAKRVGRLYSFFRIVRHERWTGHPLRCISAGLPDALFVLS